MTQAPWLPDVSTDSARHPHCAGIDGLHCAGCYSVRLHCDGVDAEYPHDSNATHCNGCVTPTHNPK